MYNCILSVCSKWTRSSAVAERPRNASCHWIFCYSLKVTQGHSKRHCSVGVCKSLLVFHWNYSVYRTVSGIFSVKEWQDLETTGRGRSRSLKMAPFDRSYYHFLLVRYCKYSFVLYGFFSYLTLNIIVTLKSGPEVIKVIQTGTIWKRGCFRSNYGRIFNRLWDTYSTSSIAYNTSTSAVWLK